MQRWVCSGRLYTNRRIGAQFITKIIIERKCIINDTKLEKSNEIPNLNNTFISSKIKSDIIIDKYGHRKSV